MTDARDIQLLVLDCDGVLTDGGLYVNEHGSETKRFHVRDGPAIKGAMLCGIQVAILSARSSRSVAQRADDLGVKLLLQGMGDKREGLARVLQWAGVDAAHTAYMGDDLQDLPAMRQCAWKLAPADAANDVRAAADHVTQANGGQGAVREAIEHLLNQRGEWDKVLAHFAP